MKYTKLEIAPYLRTPLFKHEEAAQLVALKTRTVRCIQSDVAEMYRDKYCPLKCGAIDNLENILTCNKLQNHIKANDKSINMTTFSPVISSRLALLVVTLTARKE